jgi:hypothetical protein
MIGAIDDGHVPFQGSRQFANNRGSSTNGKADSSQVLQNRLFGEAGEPAYREAPTYDGTVTSSANPSTG